ncbi:MAG: NRDE family protein [Bacteroidota bacterium]
MCLIVLGQNIHPKYKLILVANRDEFYLRPTQSAHFWEGDNKLLAGKDLEAGGTWMGINKFGHLAAVTNFRDPINYQNNKASRGQIPINFLNKETTAVKYIAHLRKQANNFNGFNLISLDKEKLIHYNNQLGEETEISDGIHAISNASLDTPWPKVLRAKEKFNKVISAEFSHDDLIELMSDGQTADPRDLPDTGIPKDLEEAVSAICIRTEKYGTCSTTAITISHEGEVQFTEKSYPVGKRTEGVVRFTFAIES